MLTIDVDIQELMIHINIGCINHSKMKIDFQENKFIE